jgi:hypothetical protein
MANFSILRRALSTSSVVMAPFGFSALNVEAKLRAKGHERFEHAFKIDQPMQQHC